MAKSKYEVTNNPKIIFGLYGAGGFAREVIPFLNESISIATPENVSKNFKIFFVETIPKEREVNGYSVLSEKEFFEIECNERYFNIAISDSMVRERIAANCISKGAKPISIRSPNSIIYDRNEIDNSAILCAYTIITSNIKIGKFFHCNIYSYIAHDCVIGDYVTFAPNVRCNGNVHIHDHAFIGTGAVIKQGSNCKPLVIGEGAIVGMGAVVTKDVPPFTVVVGNPAKSHSKV